MTAKLKKVEQTDEQIMAEDDEEDSQAIDHIAEDEEHIGLEA